MRLTRMIGTLAGLAAMLLGTAAVADAATVTNVGGVVTYAGTPANNNVTVTNAAGTYTFTPTAPDTVTAGAGCTQVVLTVTCTGVTRLVADGGAGNDTINITAAAPVTVALTGAAGDDTLRLSAAASSTIAGGDGNDKVDGSGSTAPLTITGDAGNDSVQGGDSADNVQAGDGDDIAIVSLGGDKIDLGAGADLYVLEDGITGGVEQGGGALDLHGGSGYDTVVALVANFDAAGWTASISLDDAANDGFPGGTANFHSDVENVITPSLPFSSMAGTITLTGGAGSQALGAQPFVLQGLGTGPSPLTSYVIDPGAGNDSVFGGPQNDTINTVDGFADQITCGGGVDTVTADSFDTVAPDCENVTVTYVIPNGFNDTPPTIAITTPAAGATLPTTRATTLTAQVGDDHGIAKVQYLAGTRLICEATVAPYSCNYTPTGADAPSATISAIAIDSAQQTTTARITVNIGTFQPTVSSTTTPGRDRTAPFAFTTRGAITPPAGMPTRLACSAGGVTMIVKAGNRIVARRTVILTGKCTYTFRTAFRTAAAFRGATKLTFLTRFSGNPYLTTRSAPTRTIRVK